MTPPEGDRKVAQLRHDVDDIFDLLTDVHLILDAHSATLAEHTARLDHHTVILDHHTVILDQHTATLDEHGGKLDRILDLLEAR